MVKREEEVIKSLVEFLRDTTKLDIEIAKIPENPPAKTPDFILQPVGYVVEVKEIRDLQEVKEQAAWGGTVNRLHAVIDVSPKKARLNGSYLVSTPENFKLPQNPKVVEDMANSILDAILLNSKREFMLNIDDTDLHITRFSDSAQNVAFSWTGKAKSINSPATVHENIFNKLAIANTQLSNSPIDAKINKKILLLVNEYIYAHERDIVTGLSYSLESLFSLDSIDEIWVQFRAYQGTQISHSMIWSRSFGKELKQGNISPENVELFVRWFNALEDKENYRDLLFKVIKNLFENSKPYKVIHDKFVRERIARLGEWLIEKERFDDALWLIDAFIDDPNPSDLDPWGDGDDLDAEIEEGKDSLAIYSVLGNLAWVIQKLTLRKEYIVNAFEYTEKLANHPSLYIKLQSLIPLIEITKRREWLQRVDDAENTTHYGDFKNLVFKLLNKYAQYKAFANWLAHLFFYFQDLSTDEVLTVLDKLNKSEEESALYVYFAVFRKRHYLDKDIFQPEVVEEALRTLLKGSENINLRGSIAWQFAKIIRESPDEFQTIKPWIDLMLEQPYEKVIYDDLEMALEKAFEVDPETASSWFKSFIDASLAYVADQEPSMVNQSMWLSLEYPINEFAKQDPNSFIQYLQKIFDIWKKGAYVGDPAKILLAYQSITNEKVRKNAKESSKQIYAEIKELNPKLNDIIWV